MDKENTLSISGEYAKIIQVACNEFAKKFNADLSSYNVSVYKEDNSIIVIFKSKNINNGFRGAPKNEPGFEVSLDKNTQHIIYSNFSR